MHSRPQHLEYEEGGEAEGDGRNRENKDQAVADRHLSNTSATNVAAAQRRKANIVYGPALNPRVRYLNCDFEGRCWDVCTGLTELFAGSSAVDAPP